MQEIKGKDNKREAKYEIMTAESSGTYNSYADAENPDNTNDADQTIDEELKEEGVDTEGSDK